jgi:hypothetical protein
VAQPGLGLKNAPWFVLANPIYLHSDYILQFYIDDTIHAWNKFSELQPSFYIRFV